MDNDGSDDEDAGALFRAAVGDVHPVHDDRLRLAPRPPPPRPLQARADSAAALRDLHEMPFQVSEVQPGDELIHVRDGVRRQVLRKLRRGQYRVTAELDLHGCTVTEALQALTEFIAGARRQGLDCVRIIHGKGWRSGSRGPVLKNLTDQWLRQRDEVLAYCSAPRTMGGTGAVLVLLRTAS